MIFLKFSSQWFVLISNFSIVSTLSNKEYKGLFAIELYLIELIGFIIAGFFSREYSFPYCLIASDSSYQLVIPESLKW